jgi:hypothetical protein
MNRFLMIHCNSLTKHLRTQSISTQRPRTTICNGSASYWISYQMSSWIQRLLMRCVKIIYPVHRPTMVLIKLCIAGAAKPHHRRLRILPDQIISITWDILEKFRACRQRTRQIQLSTKSKIFSTPVHHSTSYTRNRRRQEKPVILSESQVISSIKHSGEAHKCTHRTTHSLPGEAECSLAAIMLYTGTMEDTGTATTSSTHYRSPRSFEHQHISIYHGRSMNFRPISQRTRQIQ